MVNGYASYMNIGNNRLIANAGFYGGGIRVGHPTLSHRCETGLLVYDDAVNDRSGSTTTTSSRTAAPAITASVAASA